MQEPALPRFADSLCRFLANTGTPRFATGQWLRSLSEDELYRLESLIALALEHNNEPAWDDLALTCMKANGAERGSLNLQLTGDELLEHVTTLRVIVTIETMRRKGRLKLKHELSIQPHAVVEVDSPRWSFRRRAHFAH
jgi:hypothetical protein